MNDKNEKSCSFFEITHKEVFYPVPNCYIPLQVGYCNTHKRLPYINDESGDTICTQNANFCELTAWYYLYKNFELPDYVGLCHYRRFFCKKTANIFSGCVHILNDKEVCKLMDKYDIILPKKLKCGMSVKEFYYKHGEGKKGDIELVEEIIREKTPEYSAAMQEVFSGMRASYWNLAVMKRDDFLAYCEWLFTILFELQRRIDISNYSVQQARIYGYLSEILINVWVLRNNKRIYHSDMIFVDDNKIKNFLRKIRILLS